MRILLIDQGGFMLDLALRAQDAGHEVRWFIRRNRMTLNIGKGCLEGKSKLVDEWQSWVRWADVIMCGDNTRYNQELEYWRKREDLLVVGACTMSASWELDRNAGQDLMKKHGLSVAKYKEFFDYDSAIAFVKKEGRAFVCKPCGDEPDKSLTYVSKSPADLVYMLERWKKMKRHKGSFILQECVKGTEMAVGGWFGPGGFQGGWHENFEFKKLMAGDTGPATGEMGTVVRVVKSSKLADMVLKPFEEELHKINYCGYIDVNCIIDEDGTPWPLEFTTRPGWPTFNIQTAMLKGDPVEWLADLALGNDCSPFVQNKVAVGVVMAIPDFPFSLFPREEVTGIPVYGIDAKNEKSLHLCEMMRGQAPHNVNGKVLTLPCYVTAGDYLLVGSGLGDSVRQARKAAYRVLESLEVPNSPLWRPDIGDRLRDQLPKIQSQGFATGLLF